VLDHDGGKDNVTDKQMATKMRNKTNKWRCRWRWSQTRLVDDVKWTSKNNGKNRWKRLFSLSFTSSSSSLLSIMVSCDLLWPRCGPLRLRQVADVF